MRTEYTIKITEENGKEDCCVYPKAKALEEFERLKKWYSERRPRCKVEFFKVQYVGNSLYKAERIL